MLYVATSVGLGLASPLIFFLHLLLASSRRTQHIPTVTAAMVDSTPLIPASQHKKQGHRVLCCCDSRKAVIMINLVALAFYIAAIVINALNGTLSNDVVSIIFMCITILFYFTVICSAIQFHRCAVVVAIIWMLFTIVWNIVSLIMNRDEIQKTENPQATIISVVIVLIIQAFVIYAEGVYVHEVGKGIMSRETHDREKYSW